MLFSIHEIQWVCEKIMNETKANTVNKLSERDQLVMYAAYAKLIGNLYKIKDTVNKREGGKHES